MCIYIALKLPKEVQKSDAHEVPVTVSSQVNKINLSFLLCPSGMHINNVVMELCMYILYAYALPYVFIIMH